MSQLLFFFANEILRLGIWQNWCLVNSIIQTSLKIFKHYKLKPSFSIIKNNKAKNKVRVGDKPPPPSFNNLIKFDPIWWRLIQSNPIWSRWSNLFQFDQVCAKLDQVHPVWSNLIKSDPIWSNLIQSDPTWTNWFKFDPIWTN